MRPSAALESNRAAIRLELGNLLGVSVDVLTPNGLPDKFRATVIAKARPA